MYEIHLYLTICQVAYHAFIDYQRKQKPVELRGESFLRKFFDKKKTPEENVILDETFQKLMHQLEQLPVKQKLAILLFDYHDLSYREAASVMNISLSNFKVSLYRGRQAIREQKGGI